MINIRENIEELKKTVPFNVKLVAVSKTKPASYILEAWNCDQKLFGENRVQELTNKKSEIDLPVEWQMIGHLQTNKVKVIIPFVSLIQSVDSFRLLSEINKEALKIKRVVSCLLQVYIAKEESKFGFSIEELNEMLCSTEFHELKNIRLSGLMGMATFTDNKVQVRNEFKTLFRNFQQLKKDYFLNNSDFCEISMGMSQDYKIAVEEGSTMVRIGSLIFGER